MKPVKFVAAVLLAALLSACGEDVRVSVTFEEAGPVEAGAPVYWEKVQIGEVAETTVSGTLTEVELALDPELAAGLNSGSAALLGARAGRPVIELYNYRAGDERLQAGGRLVGLTSPLELAAWRAGEALDTSKQSMDDMSRAVSEYFESEEWQRQKEQMNRRMEELQAELGDTYDRTNEAYRQFLEDLESESEAARERARESYSKLAEQLREDIERLREQGNAQLVEPLMKLLEDLSRAMEKQPEPEQEST